MKELEEAFRQPAADANPCSMIVHPILMELPEQARFRAYFFMHFPSKYRHKYLVTHGLDGKVRLETNDFGQALDWILERWMDLSLKLDQMNEAKEGK